MKKNIFIAGAFAIVLAGCQDDNIGRNGEPASAGDEVLFSVEHADFDFNESSGSRTIYGERNGNSYPIYWVNGDKIGIFCPQGSSSDNTSQFDYQVMVENEESTVGTLAKVNPGENGLQWGDGDEHDFYAIYPASASEGGISATEVKCNIPLSQDPLRIEYDAETGTYMAYPNMNYAYMYAHQQVSRLNQGNQPISLNFKPLVTVLEITVNGPSSTPEGGDWQISQINVRSNENITGDFKLTVTDDPEDLDDGKCTSVANGTVSNLLSINTYYNGEPVTLKAGEKLVVKAFMLPYANPDASTTTVTVTLGTGSVTKTLSTADIQSGKINITSLPALPMALEANTYYWMSAMDSRTYVSQLSIPGSHNSYSFDEDLQRGENTQMTAFQTMSIEDQFAMGARAFSFMVGFDRDEALEAVKYDSSVGLDSHYSNWNNDYKMYVYDGGNQGDNFETALDNYVSMLQEAVNDYPVKGRTCLDFIVLNIDYKQITSSGVDSRDKYTEVRRWIREVDRILNQSKYQGIFVTDVNSKTTLKDLAGKIVVFVNYQAPTFPVSEGACKEGWGGYGEQYEGYTYVPSSSNQYILTRRVYNESGEELTDSFWNLNDRDITYPYYLTPEGTATGLQVWKQTLQRLDNPSLSSYPYYDDYSGRISTKVNITKSFFQTAITNNTQEGDAGLNQWYVNDLGGFCVVNESGSYNPDNGDSGNTVLAAHEVNSEIYNYLIDPDNNSGPLGVVLMNFFGVERMDDESASNLNIYGEWLSRTIIENNYNFFLKRAE